MSSTGVTDANHHPYPQSKKLRVTFDCTVSPSWIQLTVDKYNSWDHKNTVFDPQLLEFMDAKPIDMKGQLYLLKNNWCVSVPMQFKPKFISILNYYK